MSAIAGIFKRNGHLVSHEQIQKMNDCLSHRGPDGSKIWVDGSIAFAHQMLHTTTESIHEELPFEDIDSGLVITSDARIDNRADLAPLLGIDNINSVPDSLFILKAYQKWGEGCLDNLLGDFSFVIWDPVKEWCFCARDHMGIKPFYYYLDEEYFLFATEIKALFSLGNIDKKINKIRIADYLTSMLEDKEITFYNEIKRLTPSHSMIVNFSTNKSSCYWHLDYEKELSSMSEDEYSSEFLKIFKESVNCRLRSAFPIGSHLSGGLDSSSIVSIASQLLSKTTNPTLNTFSYTFESVPSCDETFFIQQILDKYNLNSYFIQGDNLSPLSEYQQIFWHFDGAFYAPNLFYRWETYPQVKNTGVRVMLDGIDGDTTISHGELILAELASELRLNKLFNEIKLNSRRLGVNPFKFFFTQVIVPKIPKQLKLLYRMTQKSGLGGLHGLNKDFIKKNNLFERYQTYYENSLKANNPRKYHYYKLNSGLIPFVLELVDAIAAASSIEVRYPFFDKRLIEFCLSLPYEQKLNDGWDRIILRRSMENILPNGIQWRRYKTNLNPIFERNFLLYEQENLDNLFTSDNILLDEYLDIEYLAECYNKYKYGNKKYVLRMWKATTLLLWINFVNANQHKSECCL